MIIKAGIVDLEDSMEIRKITPQGYCGGVRYALKLVETALNDPTIQRPIYMLGSIIHNQHVINSLISKGVILLEGPNQSRLELLEKIESGTVIFSAHGVSPKVKKRAIEKGLNILDTTCKNVERIHQNMEKYLAQGYTAAYIGTPNHPECEGVLGIDSRIKLISNIQDVSNLEASSLYVTNQTTLSADDTKEIYEQIRIRFPDAILDNTICNATTIRQEAMKNRNSTDLCIVVGDVHSSNTNKLVEVSKKSGINTILVEDLEDLKKYSFQNFKKISISSGASTPDELVDEIISYLEKNA